MSASIPTSVTSFAHRRSRADSTVSFTYYADDNGSEEWPEEDEVLLDQDELELEENGHIEPGEDVELGLRPSVGRQSSDRTSSSAAVPLLPRRDSASTEGGIHERNGRVSQKIYIATEDLTIVVAGFNTSTMGLVLYWIICAMTLGTGYLLFRWLPRLRIRLIGVQAPLRESRWVVIEVSEKSSPQHK